MESIARGEERFSHSMSYVLKSPHEDTTAAKRATSQMILKIDLFMAGIVDEGKCDSNIMISLENDHLMKRNRSFIVLLSARLWNLSELW